MPEDLSTYRLSQLESVVIQLKTQCGELQDEIDALRADAVNRERQQLKWGVASLGAVVMTLAGVLWSYRGVIFK